MSAVVDLKTIFFTNLQLLGFDAGAEEARNKIPFNRYLHLETLNHNVILRVILIRNVEFI